MLLPLTALNCSKEQMLPRNFLSSTTAKTVFWITILFIQDIQRFLLFLLRFSEVVSFFRFHYQNIANNEKVSPEIFGYGDTASYMFSKFPDQTDVSHKICPPSDN